MWTVCPLEYICISGSLFPYSFSINLKFSVQILPYIKKYVNSLRSAIESGRAMKANACIDMLRYVLNIGYRYEDAATPEKFNERVKKRSILWRTPAATSSVTSTIIISFW